MINKRRNRLLKLLDERKAATVHELVESLDASPSTIRRDISWLAARNLIHRTRGGAETSPRKKRLGGLANDTFADNLRANAARKYAIARHAAALCDDGETIIINGGTTTFMMADFLADRSLKIMTNSFLMADRLLATSQNEVLIPGGTVYRDENVILSPFDNDATGDQYASKMSMSVSGLSMLGLVETDPLLIRAEKRLIGQAEKLIVLVDSSKFARRAGLILCGLKQVHTVITDSGVADLSVQWLEQAGVKVIVVEPEAPPARDCIALDGAQFGLNATMCAMLA
jgi:DeoR family ulaG and ulaABCDEF operon transcriptional repressor